jgi:ubiquinone/menaquinone biosynthesis C-methylase UbiE
MSFQKYMDNQGDNDWVSIRPIDPETLISYDSVTQSPMPSLKIAYEYMCDCHNVIDLGCGTGNVVKWLNEHGHNAIGITYNHNEIAHANNEGNTNVFYGDMHELQYEDNSFDAVLSFESIEHVHAPYIALNEMKRICKPNGKIVVYIPSQFWVECPHHVIVPTIRQFKWLIYRAGLILENVHEWGDEECTYFIRKPNE